MPRRFALLLCNILVRCCSGATSTAAWDHVPNALLGPHGQPATFAQDSLSCGYLLLPAHVTLTTHTAGLLQRGGVWRSVEGEATLATWEQELFRWRVDKVYYYRGAQMLFKTERQVDEQDDGSTVERVVMQDCESVPMYTLLVRGGTADGRFEYDVLDREGDVLARARYNTSDYFPDQLFFSDRFGLPVAVAQSPAIHPMAVDWQAHRRSHQPPDYVIKPWEVSFYGASTTNSSLMLAENRWVIVAAVQDHAIRAADASNQMTDFRPLYVGTCFGCLAAIAAGISASFRSVFYAVYPPSKDFETSNPFLQSVGSYGSLGPRSWEHKLPPVGGSGVQGGASLSLGSLRPAAGW